MVPNQFIGIIEREVEAFIKVNKGRSILKTEKKF